MTRFRFATPRANHDANTANALAGSLAARICRHIALSGGSKPRAADRKKDRSRHGQDQCPGGKWDIGESLMACARREMLEEPGIDAQPLGCAAELLFVERDGPQWLGYVFVARQFSGVMRETPEARPFWCDVKDIPYHQMWADDAIWLPKVLEHGVLGDEPDAPPLVYDFLFTAGNLLEHRPSDQSGLSVSVHALRQ